MDQFRSCIWAHECPLVHSPALLENKRNQLIKANPNMEQFGLQWAELQPFYRRTLRCNFTNSEVDSERSVRVFMFDDQVRLKGSTVTLFRVFCQIQKSDLQANRQQNLTVVCNRLRIGSHTSCAFIHTINWFCSTCDVKIRVSGLCICLSNQVVQWNKSANKKYCQYFSHLFWTALNTQNYLKLYFKQ